MKCINCGKPTTEGHSTEMPLFGWRICQTCERKADEFDKLLDEGIEITSVNIDNSSIERKVYKSISEIGGKRADEK